MRFKDEDGKEYEQVTLSGGMQGVGDFLIRPIIEPKEWEVSLITSQQGRIQERTFTAVEVDLFGLSEVQVVLIKEAIEQLMVTIFDGYPINRIVSEPLVEAIDKARKALQSWTA